MQFSDLMVGKQARVLSFNEGDDAYCERLMSLGLVPGATFTVLRKAPLGDPIEILVRGCGLSLRKEEANIMQVEVL